MNREFFRIMLRLQKKQPWIVEKEDELEKLLYEDCSDCNEKKLMLLDLIERFTHLSSDDFIIKLKDLAYDIITEPDLKDETTQISAIAADSNSDSSQLVLYGLKPILEKMGWRNHKATNKFAECYKTQKRNPSHVNIILIDEFVGTGQTVINRISEIRRQYSGTDIEFKKIYVKVIASTLEGKNKIEGFGINFSAQTIINRGISDFYKGDEKEKNIKHMLDLESLLLNKYKGRLMPSFGYGSTECLYCREDGNTPNSVFPIFWWPFYVDNKARQTLLTRAMGDA